MYIRPFNDHVKRKIKNGTKKQNKWQKMKTNCVHNNYIHLESNTQVRRGPEGLNGKVFSFIATPMSSISWKKQQKKKWKAKPESTQERRRLQVFKSGYKRVRPQKKN